VAQAALFVKSGDGFVFKGFKGLFWGRGAGGAFFSFFFRGGPNLAVGGEKNGLGVDFFFLGARSIFWGGRPS